jgi:hypothetical protein
VVAVRDIADHQSRLVVMFPMNRCFKTAALQNGSGQFDFLAGRRDFTP